MRHCGVMRMGVSPLAAFGADWPSGGRRQGGGFCRPSCASSLETYHDMNVRGTDGSKFPMIAEAERRFPVRIRIALPVGGFGERLNQIQSWLDQSAGADGWAMTPSGVRGVVNDAVVIHFADVAITGAFVARWCQAQRVEIADGLYRVREDEPARRIGAAHHKTP